MLTGPEFLAVSDRRSGELRDDELRLHGRLMRREESALLECFDRFGHAVYCLALAETGDDILAEAVTERLFMDLWRRPQAFDPAHRPMGLQLVRAIPACLHDLRRPAPVMEDRVPAGSNHRPRQRGAQDDAAPPRGATEVTVAGAAVRLAADR